MPFIRTDRRKEIAQDGLKAAKDPGDLCYIHYVRLMAEWNRERKWTTVHNLYVDYLLDSPVPDDLPRHFSAVDWEAAKELAWHVFLSLEVMPYESAKEVENGPITGEEKCSIA